MLPSSTSSDESTSNKVESTAAAAAAAPTKNDLDSSDDELGEEYLRPGDVIGYFEGVFGDRMSYQKAQIIANCDQHRGHRCSHEATQPICDQHWLFGKEYYQEKMYQCRGLPKQPLQRFG